VPIVGFARISGGAPSSVRAMSAHLINQTMPQGERGVLAAYYTRGLALSEERLAILRADMHPVAARGLGIDPAVPLTHDQINGLLAGRRADGEKIEGKQYAKVRDLGVNPWTGEHSISTPIGSYDFCPQPHKSVSVAFAFAAPAEQAMIFTAHQDAARFAVGLIAREIGVCRLGDGGRDGQVPGHVGWLEFTHLTERRTRGEDGTERAGDPGLHTHFLIPNAVFAEDGRVGSLHTAKVRGLIFEASAAYNARLAQNLRDGGMAARLDHATRACVMPAIPAAICELFSKRSQGIEQSAQQAAAERGEDWDALDQAAQEARKELAARGIQWANKGGKDDQANFDDWRDQARAAGWQPPESFQSQSREAERSEEQRLRLAYETALPLLAELLDQKAVVTRWDVRAAAGHGLIHAGFRDERDINAVTRLMREEGVEQSGEKTALIWAEEEGRRYERITTALHESQELEFIALARKAADDRGAALPAELLDRKISESGLDFSDEHGRAQLAMINRLGTDGRFTVAIAAAGAGKTTALKPLVAAWQEQGRTVHGVAVAYRQADALTEAGIGEDHVRALSGPPVKHPRTFLEAARAGKLDLGPHTVVVVDEVAQLGTRQGLELLRLRDRHGFQIVALGDDKQCSSIQAGAIVDLTRRALGAERVPEILTTRRQRAESERKFVSLLREGRAKEALDLKRADGTAVMVPGGYRETIAATARRYADRLRETGEAPGIGTPINRDAHEISLAARAERRAMGRLGPDVMRIQAVGQQGHEYDMALAVGDRVRLFQNNVRAKFASGAAGIIGRNGSVMEVLALNDAGMSVRSLKTGAEGTIAWQALAAQSGRYRLAYGDAMTINTAQGSTAGSFIAAFPSGSRAADGHDAYSALTRHKDWSCVVTSGVAEAAEIRQSRALDDARPVTLDDQWGNVGRHCGDQRQKDLALGLLDRVRAVHRGSVLGFARQLQPAGQRTSRGQPPAHVQDKVGRWRMDMGLAAAGRKVADLVHDLHERVQDVLRRVTREQARERAASRQGPAREGEHQRSGPALEL